MNGAVTHRARLVLLRQIVGSTSRSLSRNRVALQAQQAGVAEPQQARVGGTVRRMTTRTALGLDREVLEHEAPLLLGMALGTGHIAISRTAHIPKSAGAMEIVAICALHKTLVHPMVEGFGELRLGRRMTLVAELRLAPREQAMLSLAWCGEWQSRQPTSLLACADRLKCICPSLSPWHVRQRAVACCRERSLKRTILLTSPPPATCSLPGP